MAVPRHLAFLPDRQFPIGYPCPRVIQGESFTEPRPVTEQSALTGISLISVDVGLMVFSGFRQTRKVKLDPSYHSANSSFLASFTLQLN